MKIAVAKYPIGAPRRFDDFAEKQSLWLREAASAGANIAVLPEYLSLELGAIFEAPIRDDLHASLAAIQRYRGAWLALYSALSQETGMRIVAGTFLLDTGNGRYRNRADLFSPEGGAVWQDKLQLTGFEKKTGVIDGGDALKVFDFDGVRAGIAICYDIEFPLPVRAQCEAGAHLLLVPSCTDTLAGATRVRVGCLARALENRSFVAKAVTTGAAEWSPALDINTGEAAVYAPMDVGFPVDGILVASNEGAGWSYADIDVAQLDGSRAQAQVANDRDWRGQLAPQLLQATVERCS
ncbi:MAG: carbon-nitrogen hydrolase family protein [Lysobacter sp.]|nr:carbon-nitrogen hydrolase family protein [Lysobacter sp.]